ncbi:MAG: hypothetical protein AAGI15_10130 [Pseudomonadota bacterium]
MWLETITVRTPDLQRLEAHLPPLLEQLSKEAPGLLLAVYSRHPTNSDLSLHLGHGGPQRESSDQGLRLAAALSRFGTVDHALWRSIPIPRNGKETSYV